MKPEWDLIDQASSHLSHLIAIVDEIEAIWRPGRVVDVYRSPDTRGLVEKTTRLQRGRPLAASVVEQFVDGLLTPATKE